LPDPTGTLPKPCKAGLIDIEWVIKDFAKNEVLQSWWNVVFPLRKVPLQGFSSVRAGSLGTVFLQREGQPSLRLTRQLIHFMQHVAA
jgi:hypothetical protein